MFSPRSLLVTGGAGFIGSSFIRYLLRDVRRPGIKVINLDSLTYAANPGSLVDLSRTPKYRLIEGNICDGPLVEELLRAHAIDTIVHFAAESHIDGSLSGPAAFIQTNVTGTATLLEAARSYWLEERSWGRDGCRFHHVSTAEVYGSLSTSDPPFTEAAAYSPGSPYLASKAASDHLVRACHHTYGLPITISSCSNNYGPLQHAEKFIPTVIEACLRQRPILVSGDGSSIGDWLYVADHCRGIDCVIRNGETGRTYNIGGESEWTNLQIARFICGQMDARVPNGAPHERLITFEQDRPGQDGRCAVDTSRIRTELGWRPQVPFEAGIAKTLDWYFAQDPHLSVFRRCLTYRSPQ